MIRMTSQATHSTQQHWPPILFLSANGVWPLRRYFSVESANTNSTLFYSQFRDPWHWNGLELSYRRIFQTRKNTSVDTTISWDCSSVWLLFRWDCSWEGERAPSKDGGQRFVFDSKFKITAPVYRYCICHFTWNFANNNNNKAEKNRKKQTIAINCHWLEWARAIRTIAVATINFCLFSSHFVLGKSSDVMTMWPRLSPKPAYDSVRLPFDATSNVWRRTQSWTIKQYNSKKVAHVGEVPQTLNVCARCRQHVQIRHFSYFTAFVWNNWLYVHCLKNIKLKIRVWHNKDTLLACLPRIKRHSFLNVCTISWCSDGISV